MNKLTTWLHCLFVVYGLYMVYLSNYSNALIYLGVALAFDPFTITQPWNEKPKWQRGILLAELTFTFLILFLLAWPGLKSGFSDGFHF